MLHTLTGCLVKLELMVQSEQTAASGSSISAQPLPEASSGELQYTRPNVTSMNIHASTASTQLDERLTELQLPAGQASDLAASSASDMLDCNEKLSSLYRPTDGLNSHDQGQQAEAVGDNPQRLQNEGPTDSGHLSLHPD